MRSVEHLRTVRRVRILFSQRSLVQAAAGAQNRETTAGNRVLVVVLVVALVLLAVHLAAVVLLQIKGLTAAQAAVFKTRVQAAAAQVRWA